VVFALLVYFDTLLRETAASTGLSYAALTGMVWGFPIGLGRVWMLKGSHSRWQIIPVIALLCGLVLMLVDQLNPVLADASTLTVFLPGTVVPFAILVAAHLADP